MRLKLFLLVIIMLYLLRHLDAQNIDSLWKVYNDKSQSDTVRIKALNDIAYSYRSNKPDTAIVLAGEELKFANSLQITVSKKWIASTYNTISVAYRNKSNYPKAMDYALKALRQNEEISDKKGIAHNYISIGLVYENLSDYSKALEYFLKALKLREEIKDKSGVADCYNRMGLSYMAQSNHPKALEYDLKSLQLRQEIGDKKGIADCYLSIASVYTEQSDPKAFDYYLKALKLCKEIKYKRGIGICFCNMAALYNRLANYKAAMQYADTCILISKEIGALDMEKESYSILATAYSKTGNYREAFENHVKFKQLTDSIFSKDNSKKLNDIANNFETEKREAEQAKLDALALEAQKRQQVIIYAVAGVLLIVFVFSIFLYRRFKITQRQKEVIEKQKHIVEEHQKEIIDSINYAERIQRSFIATKEILNENLNDYFVLFKPKDIVSGDFYWAGKLNNGNFSLGTADSTGHGVPGAIMSLLNVTSLEKAIETFDQPAEILNATRKIIIERLKKDGSAEGGKDGMDCSLCVYDLKNKKLTIAAANNPVWIVRGTETIEIKPDKMPVGKHDKQENSFTQQEVDLQSGDVVYTLTDGFPDQFGGEKGKKFMSKNLRELLAANAHLHMQKQKELLDETFKNWVGDLEQVDDVTLIGVRV